MWRLLHDLVAIFASSKLKHLESYTPNPKTLKNETQDLESVNRRAAAIMHKRNLQEQAHDGHLEQSCSGPLCGSNVAKVGLANR